jgi:hypothetical protein
VKRIFPFLWILLSNSVLFAQDVENLGLSDLHITSLKIGNGIIAVGTNYNGVYWQQSPKIQDSGWNKIDISSVHVTAVYPHKSGPLGWAIGIGTEPNLDNSEFVFCSFLGQSTEPISYGIDTNHTNVISAIDGFPDPTICGETFAIGGRKLYRRFFQDTTWHSVYDLSIEGNFASLKAREYNEFVYAGGAEGFAGMLLIRSSDKGNTWENLFPMCNVQDLDFYGETNHKIIVTDRFKVLISADNGSTWAQIFQSDSLTIQNISFSSDAQRIYVITNTIYYDLPRTYFFFSLDNGKTWESMQLPLYDLVVDMDIGFDDYIYFASISSGVFSLKSPVVIVEDEAENVKPTEFFLYQNYPNPFNPSTKIIWQSPVSSWQTLKVYDVLGNEVATLVDEYKPARSYEVEFQSAVGNSLLANGVYIYTLRAGDYFTSRKMLLLK